MVVAGRVTPRKSTDFVLAEISFVVHINSVSTIWVGCGAYQSRVDLFWSDQVTAWVGGNSTVQAEVGGFYARSPETCPDSVNKSLWNEWTGESWVDSNFLKIKCGK